MADHFQEIYAQHADLYDKLVSREDPTGNLLKAIREIAPLESADVVEMGAGTGRVTRLIAPIVKSIRAYDGSAHMLKAAEASLKPMNLDNWRVEVADNRALPAESASADVAIEGWSFGHVTGWHPDTWRVEAGKGLGEMRRVLRPGGTGILIETLGTGFETPRIVTDGLGAFFAWLEWEQNCRSKWIRTDYHFESLEGAERLTRFFFGDTLADRVKRERLIVMPECTGLWWFRME